MKRFEKWRDSGISSFANAHSIEGTPMGKYGEEFLEFMLDVDGFESGAEAYVYTVGLRRQLDKTEWYYVGQTRDGENGLEKRFTKHVRGEMTKTVRRGGVDVLDSPLDEDTKDAHVAIGVDRVEPVYVEKDSLLKARTLERERRMAYEIAIEYDTTRILGGT